MPEAPPPSKVAAQGTYVTGDFHNHTTCSDGSISMQKLVKKSIDKTDTPWGLDWFVQAGHGGSGNRNCTLAEDATLATPAYPLVFATDGTTIQGPNTSWQNTNPSINPKGRVQGNPPNQVMWRWQSIQEFQYPMTEYLAALSNQPVFMGLESVVAGHEHTSMSVITGQLPADVYKQTLPTTAGYSPLGNADGARASGRTASIAATRTPAAATPRSAAAKATTGIARSRAAPTRRIRAGTRSPQKLVPAGGAGIGERGHCKTVEAMKWMAQKHPYASYYVPAHLERAGPFNPNGNNGFNIEHLRNFNNAAPTVAFGMETQPGHGASDARGEYTVRRNNFGGTHRQRRQRRRHDLGRHRHLRRADRRRVGRAARRRPQLVVLRELRLAQPRHRSAPTIAARSQDFYPGEYQRDYVMVGARQARQDQARS